MPVAVVEDTRAYFQLASRAWGTLLEAHAAPKSREDGLTRFREAEKETGNSQAQLGKPMMTGRTA
jgi:hypothetical protein